MFNKRKRKEGETEHPMLRTKKILSNKTCHNVGAETCCSLNCCQQVFFHEMTMLLKQEFWNKSFENQTTHTLDISRRLHGRGGASCTKFVTIQKKKNCEIS
jgi:hypothetical protein